MTYWNSPHVAVMTAARLLDTEGEHTNICNTTILFERNFSKRDPNMIAYLNHIGPELVATIHQPAWRHQHTRSQDSSLDLQRSSVCLCHCDQRQPFHRLPAVWPHQ